jgi:hypothetical protein
VKGCHARAWPRGNSSVAPGSTARVRFRRIGRATPVRANYGFSAFASHPDAGRTFLAFLAPPLGAMVASFGPRSVAGRSETCGAPNGVAGARAVVAS